MNKFEYISENLNMNKLSINDIKFIKILGRGSFGKVYSVKINNFFEDK